MKHLKYLNKFFWKHKKLLLIGIVFIVIANIFALYPAEFVRKAFDTVLISSLKKHEAIKVLLKYCGLIILFAVLKGVFMYFMRQTIIVMSRKIEFDLKNEIYKQYQTLSLQFYNKNKTGDLMNRISEDVNRVRMYLGPALMYTINITVLFYLVLNQMFSINTKLTYFVLIPLPILAITVYIVSNKINYRSEKVQEQLSKLTSITQETYSAIKIIKTFVNENNTWKTFNQACKEYTKRQLHLVKIEAFFFPLIITLIGMSTILTIYIGGNESFQNNITTGNIAEFIIYINMLAWPVASIGWITSLIQRAAASQERINNFLFLKSDIVNYTEELTPIRGDINFQDVEFSYGNNKILKKISFKIKEGSTLGIFGKTGSGKSTIANLILRLSKVDKGKIMLGNIEISKLNLNILRQSIGYVPQDGYLFSGTIKENIAFSDDKINEEQIMSVAKKANIFKEIMNFKSGFDTIIGERGVQLSGGQRQRLAIARTLYQNPDIFIFDDCLSAVDSEKEQKILYEIKKQSHKKTTIIISHRISSIKNADQIIILENGNITNKGRHKDLVKKEGLYRSIYHEQIKK